MNRLLLTLSGLAVVSFMDAPAFSQQHANESQNTCGATVSLLSVTQENNGSNWDFLFDIVESSTDGATSTGSFLYDYVYFDSNNAPHVITGIQGPGWHPADTHEVRPTDTRQIPDAVSIDPGTVKIHDIYSVDCSAQVKQKKPKR